MEKKVQIEKLVTTLKQYPEIRAAWFGGSAATRRSDQYSDTDLVLISTHKDLPFQVIEKFFTNIEYRYIVKDGPYNQRFYVLADTDKTYYIDVVVFSERSPDNYSEYYNFARHGHPVVLFDKDSILEEAAKASNEQEIQLDSENELGRSEIIYRTFLKEKLRGKFIDAFTFYHRLITIYTSLCRSIHAPQKYDFTMRYLYLDLPEADSSYIENLLKVDNLELMHTNAEDMRRKIHKLLKDKA